jgi:hypothetical protein
MALTASKRARAARAELQAWYLHGLLPKLTRAVRTGNAERRAVNALDADVRALLDLSHERREAA